MPFTKVAESLIKLRDQINQMAPGRDTSSDGTIGDAAHQARTSDHNPDADGVVTAMDITHDPAHGVDAGAIAEMLRVSQDPRIKYVISNRQIFSSMNSPWTWRPYDGANAHTKHVHISVIDDKALYDDVRPWAIDKVATTKPLVQAPASQQRFTNIVATQFGGIGDPNTSAYDGHVITDTEMGVALPAFIKLKPLPKVRVSNSTTGAAAICSIVDVGPWNTNDPYWETGARPQAESGTDMTGRRTNLAGIDLTPAAAAAVGINGKGKVDWQFMGPSGEAPMALNANDLATALQQILTLLQNINATQPAPATPPAASPTQPAPAIQLKSIVDILNVILNPDAKQPLGQVNGALGDTLGNLLDGKKTAIGIIGSLISYIVPQIPALASALTPGFLAATPVSGIILPIFLAMTAWGALGKMEKWSGASPPAK
jgi:hypothetical protein